MIHRFLLSLVVALSVLPLAYAQNFLPADCKPLVDLLPAPPADDSPAGRADILTLLQVQADRTPEQMKRAERVAAQSVTSFARPVLGDWFVSKDFPQTMALFAKITKQSQSIVDDQVKKRWDRKRPYIRWSEVKPIVGRPDNTSYPSGHAAGAALWGTILAAAFPDKAEEFRTQIREATWCRVIGGVHYPTDAIAGEMLGTAIAEAMLKSAEMPAALEIMRNEVEPHIKKHREATREAVLAE